MNFGNLAFKEFDQSGKATISFSLTNGRYKEEEDKDFSHYDLQLQSIYGLSRTLLSNGQSALVLLSWDGGGVSSSQGGIAQVFTLSKGHLRVIQDMEWDTHFDAGQSTESFDANTGRLVVRTAHYIPGDAHCCVSAMDVITLRWNGARFVQTGLLTELSAYGKEKHKVLPKITN